MLENSNKLQQANAFGGFSTRLSETANVNALIQNAIAEVIQEEQSPAAKNLLGALQEALAGDGASAFDTTLANLDATADAAPTAQATSAAGSVAFNDSLVPFSADQALSTYGGYEVVSSNQPSEAMQQAIDGLSDPAQSGKATGKAMEVLKTMQKQFQGEQGKLLEKVLGRVETALSPLQAIVEELSPEEQLARDERIFEYQTGMMALNSTRASFTEEEYENACQMLESICGITSSDKSCMSL